ncbi:hypothetical protein ACWGJQ_00965 [Peribacillus simplex]
MLLRLGLDKKRQPNKSAVFFLSTNPNPANARNELLETVTTRAVVPAARAG